MYVMYMCVYKFARVGVGNLSIPKELFHIDYMQSVVFHCRKIIQLTMIELYSVTKIYGITKVQLTLLYVIDDFGICVGVFRIIVHGWFVECMSVVKMMMMEQSFHAWMKFS